MLDRYPIAKIGHGGISAHAASSHVSGLTTAEALKRADVVIDLTTIPWDALCDLSICGPMLSAALPPNTHHPVFGQPEPFDPTPREGRNPAFGNTGSLSEVSIDVYLRMARSFGATLLKGSWPE